jgi:hypothetical protein
MSQDEELLQLDVQLDSDLCSINLSIENPRPQPEEAIILAANQSITTLQASNHILSAKEVVNFRHAPCSTAHCPPQNGCVASCANESQSFQPSANNIQPSGPPTNESQPFQPSSNNIQPTGPPTNESLAVSWSVDSRPVTAAAVAAQLSSLTPRRLPAASGSTTTTHSSSDSETGGLPPSVDLSRLSPAPHPSLFESYEGSKFRLKLGGLVSAAQPFSSPGTYTRRSFQIGAVFLASAAVLPHLCLYMDQITIKTRTLNVVFNGV